jgi:hypothetical protein
MNNALICRSRLLGATYICVIRVGKANMEIFALQIGPGKPPLKLRHVVYSFEYQVILYSKQDHNHFTWCTTIVRLRHWSSTILWQRTTPVIVGRFAGRTWKILTSGVHNFPHFCVIFKVYTQFKNVAECCIPKPGGTHSQKQCKIARVRNTHIFQALYIQSLSLFLSISLSLCPNISARRHVYNFF